MKSSARRFRPLSVSQILDETVELYKSSFVLLVGIAAVMYVPYAVLTQIAFSRMFDISAILRGTLFDIYLSVGLLVVGYLYLILSAIFVTGAMTYAISEEYLGRKVTIIESFRRVFRFSVAGPLLGTILVKAMAVIVPLLVISLLGGIFASMSSRWWVTPLAIIALVLIMYVCYAMLRLALTESVVVLEMKGVRHALSRTWKLMPGSILKYLSLIIISYFVLGIVSSIVSGPTQMLMSMSLGKGVAPSMVVVVLNTLINAVVGTILAPVVSIVTILLYYDIRIRKEGFDLEMLAQELNSGAATSSFAAPSLPCEQSPYEAGSEQ